MPFVTMTCPSCGAALPPNAKLRVVACAFCGASVTYEQWVVRRSEFRLAREAECRTFVPGPRPTLRNGDEVYEELAVLGLGASSRVALAQRVDGPKERVVLKQPRTSDDIDLLEREWWTLNELFSLESPVRDFLQSRLPMPRRRVVENDDGSASRAYAYAYQSGFFQTAEDVMDRYPAGIDATAATWIWRRVLELLMGLHESGYVHGALLPPHLLVHARDHGVLVVGYSMAQKIDTEPLLAIVENYAALYPKTLRDGAVLGVEHDLMILARSIVLLLTGGKSLTVPSTVPAPLHGLLDVSLGEDAQRLPTTHAKHFHALVGQAAEQSFGPPKYHSFAMPGWQ